MENQPATVVAVTEKIEKIQLDDEQDGAKEVSIYLLEALLHYD